MSTRVVVVVLVWLLGIVIVPEISAQSGNGSLRGKVVDEQGAAMPGATVTATSPQALTPVVAVTDGTGEYRLANLPPGTYTLNTQPGEKDWQLIVGKLAKPGQWGVPYNKALEIGRVPMTLQIAKTPAEQVTISIDDTPKGGTLKVEWGTKSASIPFTVG